LKIAERLNAIKPSPTLAVSALAAKLKAEGKDIIGFGAGEPDFDTPQHIKDAAVAAMNKGLTKYTPVGGTPGLKQAIVAKFKRENDLEYKANQVLVSCGGKHSFFNLFQATLDAGDEVIIPAPYWVSYPDMVLMASGTPVIIPASIDQHFKITPQQLEAKITRKTRFAIINSPSNPTGALYSADELRALGEVFRRHPHVSPVTDDMYEHILMRPEDKFQNIVNVCPDLHARTMVMNGVSKTYSMTGWRIGYCAGPEHVITAMENVQSHSTSNPTSIAQAAAETALNGDQGCITPMVTAFRERHAYVVDALNKIPGVRCVASGGAFYAFPDFGAAIATLHQRGKLKDGSDLSLTAYLLDNGVAAVPGSAFGAEGYLRLSYATSMKNLQDGIARIASALSA
jgi:aspartate aminotransferase